MTRRINPAILVCAVSAWLAACDQLREAMEAHGEVVALAAGHRLGIEEAAELLIAITPGDVSPGTRAVDRVADAWIDYTLLALELASPDTFSDLDVSSLTRAPVAERVSSILRERLIVPRVNPTEQELRTAYEIEQPFAMAEVQQIFLGTSGATKSQIDSLARLAESVRQQAVAGADFHRLVRRYSENPPTASPSGSLSWMSRGSVTPELDLAVFSLKTGEVGETLRTDLGFHIFKVTARQSPSYESVKDRYRRAYRERQIWEAWAAFLDSLVEAAGVRLAPGALDLVRGVAAERELDRLAHASRTAPLMLYRGGVLTLGDWAESMTVNPTATAPLRFIATMDSASLRAELDRLVQERLVLRAADAFGYMLSEAEYARIREDAYRALWREADRAGFRRDELLRGEQAIATAVERAFKRGASWRLRRLSTALRGERHIRVYPDRFQAVLEEAEKRTSGHDRASRRSVACGPAGFAERPEPPGVSGTGARIAIIRLQSSRTARHEVSSDGAARAPTLDLWCEAHGLWLRAA